ncbi:serine/threonine kinase [Aureococcus anophagefferens]|nr:serine/threonine kinase [Aureococcus anophagefferens]
MVRSVAVLAWLLACASAMVPPPRGPRRRIPPLRAASGFLASRKNRRRATIAVGAALAASQLQGVARSAGFWVRAMPIWLRYRRVGWLRRCGALDEDEAAAALEALHERAAEDILAAILHMRGAYVKIGQVLSSRPDVIPRAWVEKLSALQDDVPGRGGAVARRAIRRELGAAKAAGLTAGFVDAQIGAAATGQVHRSRVDGRDVCVKVQYPEAERLYRKDLATVRIFLRLLQPEWSPVMAEISRRFLSEFDFRNEADALGEVRANLRSRPRVDDVDVEVPEPLPELSSRKIVTMAYLPDGVKLAEWGKKRFGAIPWYNPWAKVALRGRLRRTTTRLSEPRRLLLCELVVALAAGDEARVVDVFTRAGFATRDMREDLIFEWANLWFNVDYEGPLNPQFHLEQLNKADPVKAVPEDWIMASRVRFLLGGLAKHLDMSFKVADIWRPYAEEALRAK